MRQRSGEPVLIEGVRPILEALRAARRRVLEIRIHAQGAGSPGLRELEERARELGIRIVQGRSSEVRATALAEPYPEESFEDLLGSASPRFLVALDRVTDVGNLGSIARSAEIAGATGLVLEHRVSPPIAAGALRASAGALEHVRVGRTPSLPRALELARAEGLAVLVADPSGEPIAKADVRLLRGDLIWAFGSEDKGVRPGVRQRADLLLAAPQRGRLGSLGVAAAAAYLLLRTAEFRG